MGSETPIKLFEILNSRFNVSELKTLCFYLDLDYEDLPGDDKPSKIREIITHFKRRGKIADIFYAGQKTRPDIPWDNLYEPSYEEEKSELKTTGVFRGTNLGHNIDPLRSALEVMEPSLFEKICEEILDTFKFEVANREPLTKSILSKKIKMGRGIVLKGVFFETFTYAQQIFTEFGIGIDENISAVLGKETYFNEGGIVEQIHGPACIVIHSQAKATPIEEDIFSFGEAIKGELIKNVICFSNESVWDSSFFGMMHSRLYQIGLKPVILCVEDLDYQVLITNVYQKYKSQLRWTYRNYLS